MLEAGEKATIEVNKPERDAIAQVIQRLASDLDEFERSQLQSLLDKIDAKREGGAPLATLELARVAWGGRLATIPPVDPITDVGRQLDSTAVSPRRVRGPSSCAHLAASISASSRTTLRRVSGYSVQRSIVSSSSSPTSSR